MAQEIDIGGTRYIASKIAATRTGYTQDYIGQLARGGLIEAKRVSGMWYILEESLRNYKEKADLFVPQPPQMPHSKQEADVSVSFDGKDYISAHRAAKITGYNQDYIGQLARAGTILSRQVGNRWYVDRESLLSHQKEKESLLAELQSKSVGILRQPIAEPVSTPIDQSVEPLTHFNYVQESAFIPDASRNDDSTSTPPSVSPDPEEEIIQKESSEAEVSIPIRVMSNTFTTYEKEPETYSYIHKDVGEDAPKSLKRQYILGISTFVILAALGTIMYMGSAAGLIDVRSTISALKNTQNIPYIDFNEKNVSNTAEKIVRTLFGKELIYTRP